MANVKISELAVNSSPSDSATLAGVDGGETVQIPISKFVTNDEDGNVTVTGKATVKDGMDVIGESIFRNDIKMQGGGIDVTNAMEIRLWNETDSKNSVLYCSDDGELLLDGKAVATKDDIPSDSNFVTKDENGDVTVESLQVDDGITCVGTLEMKEGYMARFWSEDGSKKVSLRCDDNGKLCLNGKPVATLDDIPSGGLGCTQTPSEGLAFSLMSDGNSYGVSGIGTCADTDIIIPSVHNGKRVSGIKLQAFYNNTNITSVVIPNSVTYINKHAFNGCTSLASVVIPESVTTIGYYAFQNCTNLKIYCETSSKPSGWDAQWNASDRPVVWDAAMDILGLNDKIAECITETELGEKGYATEEYVDEKVSSMSGGTSSGGAGLSMPRIRLSNWKYTEPVKFVMDDVRPDGEFIGEITFSICVQDGTVQEGDELQICALRKTYGKYKPRRFYDKTITAEDIENLAKQPYLQFTTTDIKPFYRTESGNNLLKKPKYIRIRRPIWGENKHGDWVEVNALFSNVVPVEIGLKYEDITQYE